MMYNIYPPKKGDVTQKDLTKFALCGGNQETCICKYVIQKKGGGGLILETCLQNGKEPLVHLSMKSNYPEVGIYKPLLTFKSTASFLLSIIIFPSKQVSMTPSTIMVRNMLIQKALL